MTHLLFVAVAQVALQQPAVRGTVTSAETGLVLGYSIVTLHPNLGKQFTDGRGAFALEVTNPGTYLLSVRQIGYAPFDTQVVVHKEGATILHVVLRRLAIELPSVTVAAIPCTDPGPPDSSDTALLSAFEQLRENARRYELLAETYPFRYALEISERTVYQRGDTGRPSVQKLRFWSRDNRPYTVGGVIEPAWGPWGNPLTTVVIRSADLQDFANDRFIKSHCFRLAGSEALGDDTLLRLDFEPAARIGVPDMAGSAYLDPVTFELRYTSTWITRPERSALTDISSMIFLTRFSNIAPGVPLQDSLSVITTYRYGRRAKVTTQRTLDVRFDKRVPP